MTTQCFIGFVITAYQFIGIESLHTAGRVTKEGIIVRDAEGYRYTEKLDDSTYGVLHCRFTPFSVPLCSADVRAGL